MFDLSPAVAFFDIGNTLASVRVSSSGDHIEQMKVYPDVPPVLEALRKENVRLGILSNRGQIPEQEVNDALAQTGLLSFFDKNLILYGPKDTPRLFEQAIASVLFSAGIASGEPPHLLFVGEDAAERAQARFADFQVAPHPRLALPVLRQMGPLRYLRIRVPADSLGADWRTALRSQPLVPLHLAVEPAGGASRVTVYAIADSSTASKLDDLGFWVDRLGSDDEPLTTDLYILRDDQQVDSGFLVSAGSSFDFFHSPPSARRVLASTHEGLIAAIPAGRSVESYHFPGARHGHSLKLIASLALLESMEPAGNRRIAAIATAAPGLLVPAPALVVAAPPALTTVEIQSLRQQVTATGLKRDVERYSGLRPVAGTTTIRSRHIHHMGNASAVGALVDDLTRLGGGRLTVSTHRFSHSGRSYDNVEATLPASGVDGVVLVTAHMDSTGVFMAGYRPSVDPAPGADDDASGIAGVLSASRALFALDTALGVPRREVRFVLFNAEEDGMVGSRAYASEQSRLSTPIVAVFQMDMIGYDVNPDRTFELHAGYSSDLAVQDRSIRLAELIAGLVPQVSPGLPAPQIYPSPGGGLDPAQGRSDHASFQLEGYAACLASEDFFAGPGPAAPMPEPNPNYHLPADDAVNAEYAADIARAMIAAAWVTATH